MSTVDFLIQVGENGVQIYNNFKIHPCNVESSLIKIYSCCVLKTSPQTVELLSQSFGFS